MRGQRERLGRAMRGPVAAALGCALRQGEKESSGLERKWATRKEMEWAAAAGLRAEKKEKKIFLFFFGFFFKTNSKMQLQLNSKSDFKLSNSK